MALSSDLAILLTNYRIEAQNAHMNNYNERERLRALPRVKRMIKMYLSGKTQAQVADHFGVTRQRVQQCFIREGIDRAAGGAHLVAKRKADKAEKARDARYLKRYGCTYREHRLLVQMGKLTTRDRSPIGAFVRQKTNARLRGIGWELKLWEWWTIWQESGQWEKRGRGHSFCMARNGDVGPYSKKNVYICTCAKNASDHHKFKAQRNGK